MVADLYETLLEELGEILKIKLKPDHNTCLIEFKEGVSIQLELDKQAENLLIVCDLGEIAVGRYRENLLREALKANGLPPPRNGILACSHNGLNVCMFEMLPIKNLR